MSLSPDTRIFVAEPEGFIGQAIVRRLQQLGYHNVIHGGGGLDLREKEQVNAFFERELPDYVFVSSVKVSNSVTDSIYPAQWLRDNLMVMTNIIHAAYLYDVEKLLCLDCSSTYADLGALPLDVSYLQAELLEETQRVCTVVSHTTTELCDSYRRQYGCDFVSAVFSSLYGPGADHDLQRTGVVFALLRDLLRAREVGAPAVHWPGGLWSRDLLYTGDMADACVFLAQQPSTSGAIHVGSGQPVSLHDLADAVGATVGYEGAFAVDPRAAQLSPRGAFAGDMLRGHGWAPTTTLRAGLEQTYLWYLHHRSLTPSG